MTLKYQLQANITTYLRDRSRLLKRGCSQIYHHVDVGLAAICTTIVCKAHSRHAKHANTRWSWGIPPETFEILHSLRLNLRAFLVIYHPLMLLWTQVHKLLACMPIHEITERYFRKYINFMLLYIMLKLFMLSLMFLAMSVII